MHIACWRSMAYIYLFGQPMQRGTVVQRPKDFKLQISFENFLHTPTVRAWQNINLLQQVLGQVGGHYTYDMCCALCWPISRSPRCPIDKQFGWCIRTVPKPKRVHSLAQLRVAFSIFMACLSPPASRHVLSSNWLSSAPFTSYLLCVWCIFFNLLKGHVRDTHAKRLNGWRLS